MSKLSMKKSERKLKSILKRSLDKLLIRLTEVQDNVRAVILQHYYTSNLVDTYFRHPSV